MHKGTRYRKHQAIHGHPYSVEQIARGFFSFILPLYVIYKADPPEDSLQFHRPILRFRSGKAAQVAYCNLCNEWCAEQKELKEAHRETTSEVYRMDPMPLKEPESGWTIPPGPFRGTGQHG